MYTLDQLVLNGYEPGAPTAEAEAIDAEVAEAHPCPECGGQMRYDGYHRHHNGYTEYVALAICTSCGHEISF
jgi:predicted RNA-binding Zn-ribbon protein involved in translation (DUF1610 family)